MADRASMHCNACGGPCNGPCEEGDEQFRAEGADEKWAETEARRLWLEWCQSAGAGPERLARRAIESALTKCASMADEQSQDAGSGDVGGFAFCQVLANAIRALGSTDHG